MQKDTQVKNKFSINDFDEVGSCEVLFPVQLKDPNGDDIEGLTVSIIGSEASELVAFDKKTTKKSVNSMWLLKNKGDKNYDKPNLDEIEENQMARLQIMIKEWTLSDPCTPENIKKFFARCPSFRKQILDANVDLRNFLPNR